MRSLVVCTDEDKSAAKKSMEDLQSLFEFAEKLNRDMLLHFSSLLYIYSSETEGEKFRYKYFDFSSSGISSEADSVALVTKIGSFVHYEKNIDLNDKLVSVSDGKKLELLETLVNSCSANKLNLKQSAFRVLKDTFDKLSKSPELISQYLSNKAQKEAIFDLIMQNWDFPIKGFANVMEDVFDKYIGIFSTQEERLGLMRDVLQKYPVESRRKYASMRLLVKNIDVDAFIEVAPNLLKDVFWYQGLGMAPFVVQLLKEYLNQALQKVTKQFKEYKEKDKAQKIVEAWTEYWLKEYIEVISTGSANQVSDINEFINPQLFSINEKCLPIVISKLFSSGKSTSSTQTSIQISLLRYARLREVFVCEDNKFKLNNKELDSKIDWNNFIEKAVCHNDRHISLDAVKIVMEPRKDSIMPQEIEYRLVLKSIIQNTKNSYPDFRNDMAVAVKRFLHRLRNNFNPQLKSVNSKESHEELVKKDPVYAQFISFLGSLKELIFRENYPDAPYESIYPLLETFKVIYESFNDQPFFFRKKTKFEGTHLLDYIGFYDLELFEMFVSGFKCQWDTIRKISFEIVRLFPAELPYFTQEYRNNKILTPSKSVLLLSPIIRDIEAATFSMSLLFERCPTPEDKITFVEDLAKELRVKLEDLQKSFLDGSKDISEHMFHGLLTTFSIVLGEWKNFYELFKISRERAKALYSRVIEDIITTITFAKTVISKQHVTFILDSSSTSEAIKKKQEKYSKLVDKLDSANTLLEAHGEEEDAADVQSDNLTVVALYLISKESGALFGKLLEVVVQSETIEETQSFFDPKEVTSLVETFTDALLSIKHLGAIDKISLGLSHFCKKFYEMSNTTYSGLSTRLLNQILASLKEGDCQTIFRRSAGLPSAISALLKTEPVGMKTKVLPNTIQELTNLAETDKEDHPEVRIHALNILRILFQDSELKQDMEHFIGKGLALAIRGFSNNDWSIRNSSLMLYSAIMKRLFPNVSNDQQASMKSGLNVIQFFVLRAPSLLQYFFDEILDFSKKTTQHNMYPTIYPISLLLSKLLPYDMDESEESKEQEREAKEVKSSEKEYRINEISDGSQSRFVTAQEINQFRGLLLACAGCKNYLGRVLVARAIIPFISLNNVRTYLESILPKTVHEIRKDHNTAHGRLLIAKFVISNFKSVCKNSSFKFSNNKTNTDVLKEVISLVASYQRLYASTLLPAPLKLTYLEIIQDLYDEADATDQFAPTVNFCAKKVRLTRHSFDIAESEYNRACIRLSVQRKEFSILPVLELIKSEGDRLNTDDTDCVLYSLKNYCQLLEDKPQKKTDIPKETLGKILEALEDILTVHKKMINLVTYLVELLSFCFQNEDIVFTEQQKEIFLKVLRVGFEKNKENSILMKELIRVAPDFCQKDEDLELLSKILQHYSEPEQTDDCRGNCALALQALRDRLPSILSIDFSLYLRFAQTMVKLLVDELAPIRKLICDIVYFGEEITENDNIALPLLFKQIFTLISGKINSEENITEERKQKYASDLFNFLLELICDPVAEKYKSMACYDCRLFNFDKPNKYKEEIKIIRGITANEDLIPLRDHFSPSLWSDYLSARSVPEAQTWEKELKELQTDLYKKNEFIYVRAVTRAALKQLCLKDNQSLQRLPEEERYSQVI